MIEIVITGPQGSGKSRIADILTVLLPLLNMAVCRYGDDGMRCSGHTRKGAHIVIWERNTERKKRQGLQGSINAKL
ncbi:MAG: hypothetical protein A2W23_06485 [Planctomycetes bacterium RBG_16_43_13]|nr:MAG: hypothetical protein A2W23_06485 [Planctomycetes bacterium RBG_16_43_13]